MRPETAKIQNFLKLYLKENALLYKDIATKMKVSESTFKRLLNNEDITLSKLIGLCQCLDLDFFDVMKRCSLSQTHYYELTDKQEKYLAKDIAHFKTFRLLIMLRNTDQIQSELSLSTKELQLILKGLEEVNLIERWENNRIKLLANYPYKWIQEGPLEKTYSEWISQKVSEKIKEIKINRTDKKTLNRCHVSEILLNNESQLQLQKDIEKILERYRSISKVNLKSKNENNSTFSFFFLGGDFSWW